MNADFEKINNLITDAINSSDKDCDKYIDEIERIFEFDKYRNKSDIISSFESYHELIECFGGTNNFCDKLINLLAKGKLNFKYCSLVSTLIIILINFVVRAPISLGGFEAPDEKNVGNGVTKKTRFNEKLEYALSASKDKSESSHVVISNLLNYFQITKTKCDYDDLLKSMTLSLDDLIELLQNGIKQFNEFKLLGGK